MVRVLLIDDETLSRELCESILSRHGFDVISVGDGRLGLEILQEEDVDILLTDIIMPEMEGMEVIIKATEIKPSLPIVAISGNSIGQNYLETALRLGASAVLRKPFDRDDLLSVIEELIA